MEQIYVCERCGDTHNRYVSTCDACNCEHLQEVPVDEEVEL